VCVRERKRQKEKKEEEREWDTWRNISGREGIMKSTLANLVMSRGQDKIFFI
jgi:hypothetical protein